MRNRLFVAPTIVTHKKDPEAVRVNLDTRLESRYVDLRV